MAHSLSHPVGALRRWRLAAIERWNNFGRPQNLPSKEYVEILKQADCASWLHLCLAQVFTNCILAGYITFPTALPRIASSAEIQRLPGGKFVAHTIQNVPILWIATMTCLISITIISWLAYRPWKGNPYLLKNRLCM
jgi:hypothetical protein